MRMKKKISLKDGEVKLGSSLRDVKMITTIAIY